jgi:FkbM family methyltransferase
MVFLDVGANFGYFSCLVGSRIGVSGRGRVIAVEPNPRMFDLLSRNIKINWSMAPIEAHECAITLGGKSTDMVIPVNGAANASIFNVQACQVNGPYARMHVRGSTVDEIVAGRRVDLIKIDVEGYELHVFEGSTETFINSPNVHVVMEWSLAQMGAAKIDPNAVLDKIEKFGLNVYRLPESIHVPSGTLDSLRIKRHDLVSIPYANVYMRKHQ